MVLLLPEQKLAVYQAGLHGEVQLLLESLPKTEKEEKKNSGSSLLSTLQSPTSASHWPYSAENLLKWEAKKGSIQRSAPCKYRAQQERVENLPEGKMPWRNKTLRHTPYQYCSLLHHSQFILLLWPSLCQPMCLMDPLFHSDHSAP